MKHTPGQWCECERCQAARKLWSEAAALEDPEKLLLTDGNGDLGFSEKTKAVILRHGKNVTPWFNERLSAHATAISAEEEVGRLLKEMGADRDGTDIEIKELRTDSDELKRFEVTINRNELEDKKE